MVFNGRIWREGGREGRNVWIFVFDGTSRHTRSPFVHLHRHSIQTLSNQTRRSYIMFFESFSIANSLNVLSLTL